MCEEDKFLGIFQDDSFINALKNLSKSLNDLIDYIESKKEITRSIKPKSPNKQTEFNNHLESNENRGNPNTNLYNIDPQFFKDKKQKISRELFKSNSSQKHENLDGMSNKNNSINDNNIIKEKLNPSYDLKELLNDISKSCEVEKSRIKKDNTYLNKKTKKKKKGQDI